jgi:hypothetical protein
MPDVTPAAMSLAALYLDINRRSVLNVNSFRQQDASRAKLALKCMTACLTTSEVAQIASPETPEVDALTLAADCEALVCARVRAWWAEAMVRAVGAGAELECGAALMIYPSTPTLTPTPSFLSSQPTSRRRWQASSR